MNKFLTEYKCSEYGRYSSHVFAGGWDEADAIALRRNIGEVITGRCEQGESRSWSDIKSSGDDIGKIHYLIFVGWVGIKSGVITVDELLSDQGLLHQMVHIVQFGESSLWPSERKIDRDAQIEQLERDIGLIPCDR